MGYTFLNVEECSLGRKASCAWELDEYGRCMAVRCIAPAGRICTSWVSCGCPASNDHHRQQYRVCVYVCAGLVFSSSRKPTKRVGAGLHAPTDRQARKQRVRAHQTAARERSFLAVHHVWRNFPGREKVSRAMCGTQRARVVFSKAAEAAPAAVATVAGRIR